MIIGPTSFASVSFGNHPVGINNAVMIPHAINAPIFGITMLLRKRPKLCTLILISDDIKTPLLMFAVAQAGSPRFFVNVAAEVAGPCRYCEIWH